MRSTNGFQQWSATKLISYILNGSSRYQSPEALEAAIEEVFPKGRGLLMAEESIMKQVKGLGDTKAKQLIAMRYLLQKLEGPEDRKKPVKQSAHAATYFSEIKLLEHEEFHVLYLNRAHYSLGVYCISKGGLTGTVTDIRLILRKALQLGATAMIVAHNHPSGALKPSANDERMTKKLADAAQTIDINLLDHLILSNHGYFSFSDHGRMPG